MAGMEQLEIHSKSYIVRWVKVEEGHSISWSVQPHKKSLNFGIVKHPGAGTDGVPITTKVPSLPSTDESTSGPTANTEGGSKARRPSAARNDSQSTAQEQLKSKGFILIQWHGKCEADKVSKGTYAITGGQAGMYGLVFDNTFSKAVSKTATFVLLTYPTNAPPNSTHHLNNVGVAPGVLGTALNLNKAGSPRLSAIASESADSLHTALSRGTSATGRDGDTPSTFHVGILLKRRRKKGQGYARRYFSLDFVSCTLSYYYNRNSSALRGAIPLSLAAIVADERRREISIDSGAEIWHLRAGTPKDFTEWTKALEKASNNSRSAPLLDPLPGNLKVRTTGLYNGSNTNPEEELEWGQVESLVSRIVGTRDAIRRLAKDTKSGNRASWGGNLSAMGTPTDENMDYLNERKPFWKRKPSASVPKVLERNLATQLAVPAPTVITSVGSNGSSPSKWGKHSSLGDPGIHEHCAALLNDLNSVVEEFSTLIASSKRRRMPRPMSTISRHSIESDTTAEFFDAEGGEQDSSQLLRINRQSDEDTPDSDHDENFFSETSSVSSNSVDNGAALHKSAFFPTRPKSLYPLPIPTAPTRRTTVPPAKAPPPSLISFMRKNVGKDFSTISMPVTSNEPTGLLQRLAENMEYCSLLDAASKLPQENDRLLHVAAFVVSTFSNGRAKERALRKPFNPMLGETYELVRSEAEGNGGFRFVAEKVCHRPVKLACQAESANWSYTHSPLPTQKFWGKSAELITEGKARVALRLPSNASEHYSWNIATVFLRNMVMGEKYIEPVGTINILNETTGAKATVEFKSKGMFGGRSEDVGVESYDSRGNHTGTSLVGTWTESVKMVQAGSGAGKEIWRAGKLLTGKGDRYGFTEFSAGLNEFTVVEKDPSDGKVLVPVTDSRMRRDQKAMEDGDLEGAERWKARLEERQREKRAEMEAEERQWVPRWFVIAGGEGTQAEEKDGDEVWILKPGKEGYWEARARAASSVGATNAHGGGVWDGVEDVLDVLGDEGDL